MEREIGNLEEPSQELIDQEQKQERYPKEYLAFWEKLRVNNHETWIKWYEEKRNTVLQDGAHLVVEIFQKKPDTIVFMDRSARPLASLFRQIWRRIYPDVAPPAMKFMVGIRHADSPPYKAGQAAKDLVAAADDFNGKTVLLFDEVVSTGSTLRNTRNELQASFPGIKTILLGGASDVGKMTDLDIGPQKMERGIQVGNSIYGKSYRDISEVPGRAVVVPNRHHQSSSSVSSIFSQIGKHERIDLESGVFSINKYKEFLLSETDPVRRARLEGLIDAYKKMM